MGPPVRKVKCWHENSVLDTRGEIFLNFASVSGFSPLPDPKNFGVVTARDELADHLTIQFALNSERSVHQINHWLPRPSFGGELYQSGVFGPFLLDLLAPDGSTPSFESSLRPFLRDEIAAMIDGEETTMSATSSGQPISVVIDQRPCCEFQIFMFLTVFMIRRSDAFCPAVRIGFFVNLRCFFFAMIQLYLSCEGCQV